MTAVPGRTRTSTLLLAIASLVVASVVLASLALASLAITPCPAAAQSPPSMLDSYRRATALVDSAVVAHGGAEALRVARHVRVTMHGHDFHRYQSRRVAAPYDSTVRRNDLMIDLARGRLVQEQTRGYPGGFSYTTRFVTDGARGFAIDVRNHTYSVEEYPPADQQLGNLLMLPQFALLAAHEDQSRRRRWLGPMRLPSGATVHAMSMVLANGALVTLGFDPATHRLRARLDVGVDPLLGDEEVATEYEGWRVLDGVLLPARSVQRRGGVVTSDVRFTSAESGYTIPDSLLAPPPRFAVAAPAPPPAPTRELAPGVWDIRSGSSSVLAVAFDDHVLVVDAPPRGVADVVSRLATLAPGRPIRYIVPTHHHDDHLTGVREYAAGGATIVTTPGNAALVAQVASPSARVEIVTGRKRVFTDGRRTVEIHDVGPSPHADEMLVAWLPAEGILFHADLIEAPTGVARRGSNAETTTHLAQWIRRRGWTVRTFGGAHGFLAGPAEFETLVQHPILPPM